MRYLLDSDAVSDLYDSGSAGHPAMTAKLASLSDSDEVCISILAIYELEYGLAHAPTEIQPILRRRIEDAQSDFSVLPLTPQAARRFGTLKAGLTKKPRAQTQGKQEPQHRCHARRQCDHRGMHTGQQRLHLSRSSRA